MQGFVEIASTVEHARGLRPTTFEGPPTLHLTRARAPCGCSAWPSWPSKQNGSSSGLRVDGTSSISSDCSNPRLERWPVGAASERSTDLRDSSDRRVGVSPASLLHLRCVSLACRARRWLSVKLSQSLILPCVPIAGRRCFERCKRGRSKRARRGRARVRSPGPDRARADVGSLIIAQITPWASRNARHGRARAGGARQLRALDV